MVAYASPAWQHAYMMDVAAVDMLVLMGGTEVDMLFSMCVAAVTLQHRSHVHVTRSTFLLLFAGPAGSRRACRGSSQQPPAGHALPFPARSTGGQRFTRRGMRSGGHAGREGQACVGAPTRLLRLVFRQCLDSAVCLHMQQHAAPLPGNASAGRH